MKSFGILCHFPCEYLSELMQIAPNKYKLCVDFIENIVISLSYFEFNDLNTIFATVK